MNKILFTDPRLFMAVVGPSGCGKTRLVFEMLLADTFYPRYEKIYYFYQEYQSLYTEMGRRLSGRIEFIKGVNFEMISQLDNCLLIFDDSCEEIYADSRFVKLATSGRHRKIHILYIKHNLFFQSKYSKTIDLNNTHLVLFKSPRDVNQIHYLGNQLKLGGFVEMCYKRATAEPYGHLLIDFDPKTPDQLRFASNITGPGPSVFYLQSWQAVRTPVTDEREKLGYSEALAKPESNKFATKVPVKL